MCVFRRERDENMCVYVYVSAWEREREHVCVSVCLGERERACVCVHSQYVYILMQKAVSEKFNSGFL